MDLFPVLEELHTTCLLGLPVGGNSWLRSAPGLRAVTLIDDIFLWKRRPDDQCVLSIVNDLLQVVSTEAEGVQVDVRVRLSNDTTWPLPPWFFRGMSELRRPGRLNLCLLGVCRRDCHRLSRIAMRARPRESLTVMCHTDLTMLRQLRTFLLEEGIPVLDMPRVITVEVLQDDFNAEWMQQLSSLLPLLIHLGPQWRLNVHNTRLLWDPDQLGELRGILAPYRDLIQYTFW